MSRLNCLKSARLMHGRPLACSARPHCETSRSSGGPVTARREMHAVQHSAAVRREAVSEAPKGTSIEAAETQGGTPKNWIVDGTERVDTDQLRVKVIEQV